MKNLRVWDVTKGVQKMVYTDFQTSRTVPFYSTEGELFAIIDGQDTIEVWNMERCEKIEIPRTTIRGVLMPHGSENSRRWLFADMRTDTYAAQKDSDWQHTYIFNNS